MSFKKFFIGSAAVFSLAACSQAQDKVGSPTAGAIPAISENGTANTGTYNIGTPNYIFQVGQRTYAVDGNTISQFDISTFSDFPMLASAVSELTLLDRVIVTKENALEIYEGKNLLAAFDLRTGSPSLMHSQIGRAHV